MTGHQINSLVGDLVAMAQAMEKLPQVEAQAAALANEIEHLHATVQSRELHILGLKSELELAQATIRSLEVSRDDAELRFLELDDKCQKLYNKALGVQAFVNELVVGLDETKPSTFQPEPTIEPMVSEVKPIESPLASTSNTDTPSDQSSMSSASALQQGQSEPDPMSASVMDGNPLAIASAPIVETEASADGHQTGNPPGPYTNRRYIDTPDWVSREDWLAGGGTNEDYYWRPLGF